ncbi:chemotaxis protein CheX [Caldimicrobium thiodismutans]|jgi:chemotaxis protein CheX|uniref:Chemotaxis protein CheX n=1 Tax=Caldimicrobium thiodismutans TaxID=1653476 RepID=A0A0U5APV7_9BACT|nr:chemotaxis protein CheX [Caldimicrobium thiodismutans]BAU23986.1 chemotaxis protein CheX [Caldimicrobium thiodismutans]
MANTIAEAIKEAVTEVITTYTGNSPELTATEARKEDFALAEISSIIGLTGEKLQGAFVVSMERELLFQLMQALLGEAPKDLNQEALDMAGELSNMICGGFRRRFEKFGTTLKASVPSMITGKDYKVHSLCKTPRVTFKFKVGDHPLYIEFCLDKIG